MSLCRVYILEDPRMTLRIPHRLWRLPLTLSNDNKINRRTLVSKRFLCNGHWANLLPQFDFLFMLLKSALPMCAHAKCLQLCRRNGLTPAMSSANVLQDNTACLTLYFDFSWRSFGWFRTITMPLHLNTWKKTQKSHLPKFGNIEATLNFLPATAFDFYVGKKVRVMLVRLLLPRSIRRPQWTTTTAASFHCRASGLFQEESDDVPRIRLPPVSAELSDPLRAIDSHRPKIRSRVLSDTYYQQLQDDLSLRFTVPQLRHYLKSQNKRVPSKAKKKDLLLSILNDAWGLSSQSMAREAERRKRQGRIRHHFKAEREELFFIIGENGATLREIEDNHRVRVTINVEDGQYAIEGRKQDVEAAKRAIKEHLHLVHESMDIPPLSVGLEEMIRNFQPVLVDISRGSGTFIDIQDGKVSIDIERKSCGIVQIGLTMV